MTDQYGGHRVHCECGAVWRINDKEYDAGELKMDWHIKYFNRPATKPD